MDHLKIVNNLAKLLDSEFRILGFRFGLDPLIGLVPGIGDVISAILSFYILWVARSYGVPDQELGKMIRNIFLDLVMGSIPVIGDLGDFVFKANKKNIDILNRHLGSRGKKLEVEEGRVVRD